MIIEYAYAKINLTLNVLGKNNGYHDLETIMAPIDLCDILTFFQFFLCIFPFKFQKMNNTNYNFAFDKKLHRKLK